MSEKWPDMKPRLRRLRMERGLDSLAVEIGCSRASVDRWTLDDDNPRATRPHRIFAQRIEAVIARADVRGSGAVLYGSHLRSS